MSPKSSGFASLPGGQDATELPATTEKITDDELDAAAVKAMVGLERLLSRIPDEDPAAISPRSRLRIVKEFGGVARSGMGVGLLGDPTRTRGGAEMDDWKSRGLCRDTPAGDWVTVRASSVRMQRLEKRVEISICRVCPVADECLDYAMTYREPSGIWGGMLPKERRELAAISTKM